MKRIILCVDDCMGMMFNQRRVSRDKAVIADIINDLGFGSKIYAEEYSRTLFEDSGKVKYVDDPFSEAGKRDHCFAEHPPIAPYLENAEELVIYHWNRHYPSDTVLDFVPDSEKLIKSTEFVGNAHEKITKEIYKL